MNLLKELRNPSEPYRKISLGDLCQEAADKIERTLKPLAKIAENARRRRPCIEGSDSVLVPYHLLCDVEKMLNDEQTSDEPSEVTIRRDRSEWERS